MYHFVERRKQLFKGYLNCDGIIIISLLTVSVKLIKTYFTSSRKYI